ncbi:MYXO-CTERM sorting domain-containing protein [Nannocystis bainbridge]|uniref:MYXO-CTERM sorting domain-containing protein n=1 Tax=Nannocystis bainbridge TaxID=2995303 RepID=A0ABT5E0J1_9BACT|nr:MYXO-CTERM sorting domain-containing protein [Nannocystis bainbridge]MDC0718488.1 MYXO-CTERM sorting domain-containing protein [Nannocystis bainbridge]
MTKTPRNYLLRRLTLPSAFALAALSSTVAYAGEVKVGATPIEIDGTGKITAKGKSAVVDTLDEVPGEDRWIAYVHAKLENPAPGPLYVEFFQELDGNRSSVWRHDENDFAGDKWFYGELELDGRKGFNKNRTYDIKVTQVNAKGKELTLASGKIKLIKSGKKPEAPKEDESAEDKAAAEQDAHDSLGGGDGNDGSGGGGSSSTPDSANEGPPPVEKKKGCSVDADGNAWNGAMVLMALGAGFILRRRR